MSDAPLVLPSSVAKVLETQRETRLLGAGKWKVVWCEEPARRIQVIHVELPRPAWATDEWTPDGADSWFLQDVACRAVLQVFVGKLGWECAQVDEAMGEGIEAWAANPQRTMGGGTSGKNDLVLSYEAVRAHIVGGGRLRDVPIKTVEVVAEHFGLSIWYFWLQREVARWGPFEGEYADLVGDLWHTQDKVLPRVQ